VLVETDNPYRSPEAPGLATTARRDLLRKITPGKACILVVLMGFVGVVVAIAFTLVIWATQGIHPADKWYFFRTCIALGAFGGFIGGCVWCATLFLRQRWRNLPTP
jgi:hypothetical protein